ncbi:MAG: DUF255 domain-containing protein [Thermoanaerobacteraceae bacterium]|nr:DUF255 domain-containing protein [Thermoanaerobacteraceae bacterium]
MDKNSVKWHEWNESTFNKAKAEDKLILLDISASWCHWCHVMDNTSYADGKVIKYIEDNFIPVRVDRDKRPDIDSRYNLGGWPSTVVLSPEGQILTGGIYIPPEELLHMLKNINMLYREHDGELIDVDDKKNEGMSRHVKAISRNLDDEVQEYVLRSAIDMFDIKFGGFGKRPKFLYPELLSYLIGYYYLSNEEDIKKVIIKTMDIMYSSEIYDRVEGGFFRYATERDFSSPHYEKLLDDNARLMFLYMEAYQVFNLPRYMEAAEDIMEYLEKNLYDDKKGLFYGSQDADEKYYNADKNKRTKLKKPSVDKTFYTDKNSLAVIAILKYYSITGKNEYLQIAIKAANTLLRELMDKSGLMKHHPESKEANILEDQVYAVNLLLELYGLTGDEIYLDESIKLVDKVIEVFYDGKDKGFLDFLPINEIKYDHTSKSLPVNSEMVKTCMKLFALTDKRIYYQKSEETLLYFTCIYSEYGIFASSYAKAIKAFVDHMYKVTLVGKTDDVQTTNLFRDLKALYYPYRILEFLDITKRKEDVRKRGYNLDNYPQIYVCAGDKCLSPVDNIENLKLVFENLKTRERVK